MQFLLKKSNLGLTTTITNSHVTTVSLMCVKGACSAVAFMFKFNDFYDKAKYAGDAASYCSIGPRFVIW